MTCGIYVITHRDSGKKYVGQSINIEKRTYAHSVGNTEVAISRAIRKYGIAAFSIETIEECAREMLGQREIYWISHLNSLMPSGYNLTTGGEQPVFSEETLELLRYKQRNRTPEHVANKLAAARRPETIKKLSESMKGREFSEETRRKLSESMKGRPLRESTKHAMSVAAKARIPAFVERMVLIHKGKSLTSEHKLKLSEALKNPSAETRCKMSAAATGRKHSDETIQAMIDSRKTEAWRAMCAKGAKGVKQTPEQIAKRVAATAATKAARKV